MWDSNQIQGVAGRFADPLKNSWPAKHALSPNQVQRVELGTLSKAALWTQKSGQDTGFWLFPQGLWFWVSGSFFHPQPPSLLILLSEPGSERKVLTKES